MLVIGVGMEAGGFAIPLGKYTVPGMALAALIGVILNLILPKESEGLAIESPGFDAEFQAEAAEQSVLRRRRSSLPETGAPFARLTATAPGCDIAVRGRFRTRCAVGDLSESSLALMPAATRAWHARCTPHVLVGNGDRRLEWGIRLDAAGPKTAPSSPKTRAARRRRARDQIALAVCVGVLVIGGVSTFAWARTRTAANASRERRRRSGSTDLTVHASMTPASQAPAPAVASSGHRAAARRARGGALEVD